MSNVDGREESVCEFSATSFLGENAILVRNYSDFDRVIQVLKFVNGVFVA